MLRLSGTAGLLVACATAAPSVPPPISANAAALQQQITSSVAHSVRALTIEPGTYIFSNSSATIVGARNLDIDATGVTFLFYYGYGVVITNCHNLSVRGLTLDSDPPNYAQGVVTGPVEGGNSSAVTATFDDRFLPPDTGFLCAKSGQRGSKIMFWDPATKLPIRTTLNFMEGTPKEQTGGGWRVGLQIPLTPTNTPVVGSLVTLFGRRGVTWQATNSSQVLAEDVTIYAGGNMGFHENFGPGGHIYRRVKIMRRPGSPGLMALNADGFHSYSLEKGSTLEDSEISFTGDDFLNLWSGAYAVCSKQRGSEDESDGSGDGGVSSLLIVDTHSADKSFGSVSLLSQLRGGDVLTFFKLLAGRNGGHTHASPLLGEASVETVSAVTDSELLSECRHLQTTMEAPPYNAQFVSPGMFGGAAVFKVTFAHPLAPEITNLEYNLVSIPRMNSANAVVRRNHFHDSAGSGGRLLLQTPGLQLVDNKFERFNGIFIWAGEQIYMGGSLGLHNVSLRNTTVVDGGVQVCAGLSNVTCQDTTFVSKGHATHQARGCTAGETLRFSKTLN